MRIYIIAGEPSGDFLGSGVVQKLSQIDSVELFGVGGPLMESAGLKSLFDIKEISVGGLAEVIPHIIRIKSLIRKTADDILKLNPDILFTIDSPGFCFRVAEIIKKRNPNIKLVHLVAPSVWAWRSGRAKSMAELYDHLLTLFDFEPPYFTKFGLETTFVGHPAIEKFVESDKPKSNTLLLLPGSRTQEIRELLPIFLEASKTLGFDDIVIPTIKNQESYVKSIAEEYTHIRVITDESEKISLYRGAKLAIVASGTATLQLALSGCPMIVCYRLSGITYNLIKPFVKVKYISLVNLILNSPVVPELIQSDCSVDKIRETFQTLNYQKQKDQFKLLRSKLKPNNYTPTEKIVNSILSK